MKKLRKTALLLACLMLVSCMGIAAVAGEENPNLIVNGTFDTGLDGWGAPEGNTWNEDGYLVLADVNGTVVSQSISNMEPGARYLLSFDFMNLGDNSGYMVYVYWTGMGGTSTSFGTTAKISSWTRFAGEFVVPQGCTGVGIHLRNPYNSDVNKRGGAYDNIALRKLNDGETVFDSFNPSMEELNTEGTFPNLWTPSNSNVTLETAKVFDGTNAIKIANTEASQTSSVSLRFSTPSFGSRDGFHEFYIYYRLEDTNFTAGSTTEGAKMLLKMKDNVAITNSGYYHPISANETLFFTKEFAEADGWRQMMVFTPCLNGDDFTVTIQLTGIATLYLDNFDYNHTYFLVNGGFQGLYGDGLPSGWFPQNTTDLNRWTSASPTIKLGETLKADGKTYENVVQVKCPNTNDVGLKQFLAQTETVLTNNSLYELGMDYVNTDPDYSDTHQLESQRNSAYLTHKGGFAYPAGQNICSDGGSGRKNFYLLFNGTENRIRFGLGSRTGNTYNEFDNITFRLVTEALTVTQNGVTAQNVKAGDTLDVYYEAPGVFDGTNPEKSVQVVAAVYKNDAEGIPVLVSVAPIQTAQAKAVFVAGSPINNAEAVNGAGYVPAKASMQVQVPSEEGEYTVKAFVWNSLTDVSPYLAATVPAQ
ncbi:MAG: hypothetical protein E7408_06680 [Ruminococcaceae bacterium]|nr:hypothetical protein [Oscillospiraceae bacterium]